MTSSQSSSHHSIFNEYKSFNVTFINKVAHIQFSRPESMNSMNKAFWVEFPICIRAIESHTDARVIVISSTGKHFSAGMDLSVFNEGDLLPQSNDPSRMAEALRRLVLQLQASINVLEEVRLPILVAVQGACIGGALDLICAADMRYCTEDAYFTIKEIELGMTADMGTLQRLPKLIPAGIVKELAFTGCKLLASEAQQFGLVNRVYSDHEIMISEVLEIATQIAGNSPLAVTGCKEMLNYSRDHSVEDSLKYMATWQSGMFRHNDMIKSFQAKSMKSQAQYDDLIAIKGLFED
jgi:enoyl-CoA hydratase